MRAVVVGLVAVGVLVDARTVAAQDKDARVVGVVKDEEGRGLDGATIEILGTKRSATSKEGGDFAFDRVPAGRHWVVARRIGYAPIRLTLTLESGRTRQLTLALEKVPQRLSELTVVAHGGMSAYRHQDFLSRSRSAFGTFLTRDDLNRIGGHDVVAVVQRHLPGKTRFTLERRTGDSDLFGGRLYRRLGSGKLYARDELGFLHAVGNSWVDGYHNPNCTPSISVNGATPWGGVSLIDFDLEQLEAIEIYRRGRWVPTEFAYRESSGCGLVVLWTK